MAGISADRDVYLFPDTAKIVYVDKRTGRDAAPVFGERPKHQSERLAYLRGRADARFAKWRHLMAGGGDHGHGSDAASKILSIAFAVALAAILLYVLFIGLMNLVNGTYPNPSWKVGGGGTTSNTTFGNTNTAPNDASRPSNCTQVYVGDVGNRSYYKLSCN